MANRCPCSTLQLRSVFCPGDNLRDRLDFKLEEITEVHQVDLTPLPRAEFLCHDLQLDEDQAREISPAFLALAQLGCRPRS